MAELPEVFDVQMPPFGDHGPYKVPVLADENRPVYVELTSAVIQNLHEAIKYEKMNPSAEPASPRTDRRREKGLESNSGRARQSRRPATGRVQDCALRSLESRFLERALLQKQQVRLRAKSSTIGRRVLLCQKGNDPRPHLRRPRSCRSCRSRKDYPTLHKNRLYWFISRC